MIKKTPSINLFAGRNKSFVDRFLKWALSIGRLLIILTEVVALSAFLYRFSLDRQLIDLHDKIKQEQNILDLYKNNEKKYRNLQSRLAITNQLSNNSEHTVSILNRVLSAAPTNVIINSLSFEKKSITINANAPSVSSISTFIKKLKENSAVKNINLGRIDNKISNSTVTFGLLVILKE